MVVSSSPVNPLSSSSAARNLCASSKAMIFPCKSPTLSRKVLRHNSNRVEAVRLSMKASVRSMIVRVPGGNVQIDWASCGEEAMKEVRRARRRSSIFDCWTSHRSLASSRLKFEKLKMSLEDWRLMAISRRMRYMVWRTSQYWAVPRLRLERCKNTLTSIYKGVLPPESWIAIRDFIF